MNLSLTFDPLLDWPFVGLLAFLAAFAVGFGIWRGLPGWLLRAVGFLLLLLALAGPQLKREETESLGNVAFLVVDQSESVTLEERSAQITAAAEALTAAARDIAPDAALDLRVVEVRPEQDGRNRGTRLLGALDTAAARVAPGQISGAILLTDGQVHDTDRLTTFPAPVHTLIAGEQESFDLRLSVQSAPAFGIVGEAVTFRLRADALGLRPAGLGTRLMAEVSIDGGEPRPLSMALSNETELAVEITHGGPTVVDIRLPGHPDELTTRNNRIISTVSGVRDRLRVLLVSGEPHPGGRTWRDLLKSDPTVDLIHFTILRPPAKQDGTPVSELSLIAFPTRELFLEKISGFDLIIFDRYRWRGVLASAYLANVARYVRDGGAVLVASGTAFAGVQSLYRTPLSDILPAEPTLDVFERPFLPRVSELGQRHPVTAGLEAEAGIGPDGPLWGRWIRHVSVDQRAGHAVMEGDDGSPLLILDRVEEGRVALLASDHAWLWSRGFEGGGPQADLLRRTAHWLMREPELEEDALFARVDGSRILLERRSLEENPGETVNALPPAGGGPVDVSLRPSGPGRWTAVIEDADEGLWRFSDGIHEAVAAVGPPAPAEYTNPLASMVPLAPLVEATRGKSAWLADGVPGLRLVDEGRRAHGRNWIGLEDRGAERVTGVRLTALMPGWLAALAISLLMLAAWRREGR